MNNETKELLSRLNIDETNINQVEQIVLDSDISIENKEEILRVGMMEKTTITTPELTFLNLVCDFYRTDQDKFKEAGIIVSPIMYNTKTFEPEVRIISKDNPEQVYMLSLTKIIIKE